MTTPEDLMASGRAIFALDTNAVLGFRRLQHLCNVVNHLRTEPDPLDFRLYVPAVVHMEVLFDLRQMCGEEYDPQEVLQGLIDKGLHVQPFEGSHAEHAAARLGKEFPKSTDWYAAKRKQCVQCLGLSERDVRIVSSGKSCGATIDFVIAAHASHEGWILVTDDNGPDFAELELKIKLGRLEEVLNDLLMQRRGPVGAVL